MKRTLVLTAILLLASCGTKAPSNNIAELHIPIISGLQPIDTVGDLNKDGSSKTYYEVAKPLETLKVELQSDTSHRLQTHGTGDAQIIFTMEPPPRDLSEFKVQVLRGRNGKGRGTPEWTTWSTIVIWESR